MFVKLFLNIFLVKVLNTIVYRTVQSIYTNNPHNYIYLQTDELSYTFCKRCCLHYFYCKIHVILCTKYITVLLMILEKIVILLIVYTILK